MFNEQRHKPLPLTSSSSDVMMEIQQQWPSHCCYNITLFCFYSFDIYTKFEIDPNQGLSMKKEIPAAKMESEMIPRVRILCLWVWHFSTANVPMLRFIWYNGSYRDYHMVTCGFLGTLHLNPALREKGYSDNAYWLLLQNRYPSWLYPIYIENSFGGNNSMNSFNYYFQRVAAPQNL